MQDRQDYFAYCVQLFWGYHSVFAAPQDRWASYSAVHQWWAPHQRRPASGYRDRIERTRCWSRGGRRNNLCRSDFWNKWSV